MQEVDLYEAISRQDDMKLRDIVVYGKVIKAIEKKGHIQKHYADGGNFVLVEVYGVQAINENYFQNQTGSKTNLAIGTMVALCDDLSVVGKNVRIYKSKGKGCDVRLGNRFNPTPDSVTCLTFIYDKNVEGNYRIQPNNFELFGDDEREGFERGGEALIYSEAQEKLKNEDFTYPLFTGLPESQIVEIDISGIKVQERVSDVDSNTSDWDNSPSRNEAFNRLDPQNSVELVSRAVIEEEFPYASAFDSEIERTKESREEFIEARLAEIDSEDGYWKIQSVLLGFYHQYVRDLYGRDAAGVKNKEVVTNVLTRLELKNTEIDDIFKEIDAMPEFFYSKSGLHPVIDNRYLLFLSILDELLSTRYTAMALLKEDGVSDYALTLIENPYVHAMMNNRSVINADKVFFFMELLEKHDRSLEMLTEDRDIVLSVELLTSFSVSAGSIVSTRLLFETGVNISKSTMFGITNYGLPYTSNQYEVINDMMSEIKRKFSELDNIQMQGLPSSAKSYSELEGLLPEIGKFGANYHTLGWYRGKERFVPVSGRSFVEKLDQWGIGVHLTETDEMIASNYFEMEKFIYTKTREMGSESSGVEPRIIERAIMSYEDMKGFKLEELQKEAIHIVLSNKAGVLTGQAGSGKTTVAEVMVMALKASHPDYEIKFAAPTGKAANRMKEVLGDLGEVRTIHSLFKLGIDLPNMFSQSSEPKSSEEKVIYIMDEMAMCTTDVLYQVTNRLSPHSMIYFLGDIKQLPPIGKGLPFRDMLNYMPAKELGVSKRAKDGSGINFNCDIINQRSYASNFETLKPFDDFLLVSEGDQNVVKTLLNGVRHELNNYNGDDIQVATPYATAKKSHSSTSMNPALQDIFLPDADVLYTYRNNKFKLGARVIHTKSNWRDKMRYSWDGKTVFTQIRSAGVVNGEVGKLIGIVPSDKAHFQLDEDFTAEYAGDTNVELQDDIVDPKHQKKTVYIVFETQDADLGIPAVLVYKARVMNISSNENEGVLISSGGVDKLELAYALTVHKLQGSQAKLVIIPFMAGDNANFITRNMLYTAVSRAQDKVVLIGSVDGKNSMVSLSRRSTSVNSVKSMMSVMSGIDKL